MTGTYSRQIYGSKKIQNKAVKIYRVGFTPKRTIAQACYNLYQKLQRFSLPQLTDETL